jgi:diguanylate cyclase (GGDEF)-like protein/PAS domain S-box-containing protein
VDQYGELMLGFAVLVSVGATAVYLLLRRRLGAEVASLKGSEARFRGLTELSADWFWETDPQHRVTWLSGGAPVATFFGQTPTFGKRFWEIPRVEVEPRALEAHLERLEQQLPFFDLEIARSDERGARQIHIISGQSRRSADGAFLGYRGVGRDVTEQRRAERALFEAKERLELALHGGDLAEWYYLAAEDELYAGDGWVRFLGHERSPATTRGREFFAAIHAEDRAGAKHAWLRALKGEAPEFEAEFRVASHDGSWKWLHAKGRVVERDAGGRALRLTGVVADIGVRKRAQIALQEAEQRNRALVELAPVGVLVHCGSVIEYANPVAARMLAGGSQRSLLGRRINDLIHPEEQARALERQRYLAVGPGRTEFEERRLVTLDGRTLHVETAGVSFLERGRLIAQSVFRDIGEQRRARVALADREQRFRDLAEVSGEYLWETDARWRYTFLSERVEAVLGFGRAEMLGRTPQEFMPLGEARHVEDWLARHAAAASPFRDLEHRMITKSGGVIWQSVSGLPVRDAAGAHVGYRGTAADVSARREAQARIERLSTRDPLTGLPNRALLAERAGEAILGAARARTQLAVLCFDLDRFRVVNDALGHQAGDALLRAVAQRLQHLFPTDAIARLGGDEFVLIETVKSADEAAALATRMLGVLARAFNVEGRTLGVGASVGISLYPADGRDFAELLRNADAAMYHAKRNGRGTFRFFDKSLYFKSVERLQLENELRGALTRGELVLHWQPVVRGSFVNPNVVGAEALVRWQHPERGLLMPDDFVPLAEECGLIRAVDEWALERALSQAGAWRRLGLTPRLSVNVSAAGLAQGELFVERVARSLKENQAEGALLELEITERVLMSSLADNAQTLRRVGELGVRFSIDDFGTGYSSLAYLRLLPIHKLKIDRSFLRELHTHPADEAIVRAICAMAKTLGISIAAEGVETAGQLERLMALGCEDWQGHLFSASLSAPELEKLLSPAARAAAQQAR